MTAVTIATMPSSETFLRRPTAATLVLTGNDRVRWLNGMLTADLTKLAEGSVAFGLLVTKTGKVRAETWIASVGPSDGEPARVLVALPDADADEIAAELDRYLVMDDVEMRVSRGELAWSLRFADASGAASEEGLARAWVRRGSAHALVSVGPAGEAPAATDGGAAWEAFRVRHFIPEFGVDYDAANYPQEAALEIDGVSFQKGCYLGQEAVFMLQHRGHVKKRLVQLALGSEASGSGAARGDAALAADGAPVGEVTSAAGPFALAMVKYKSAFAGTELRVRGAAAHVTPLLAIVPESD